jgi:hypothetical protein
VVIVPQPPDRRTFEQEGATQGEAPGEADADHLHTDKRIDNCRAGTH